MNLQVAVAAASGGLTVLPPTSGPRARAGLDVPGVALATGGLVALVYACTEAVRSGWSSTTVIGLLAASVVLLAFFAFREGRTANPLLPPRIVADRNRGGAYIVVALVIAGMFGPFLFLTYIIHGGLRYTPLQTGLSASH